MSQGRGPSIWLLGIMTAGLVFESAHAQDAGSGEVSASPDSAATQISPCEVPEARQFDFWVGEWDLTWGEDGTGVNVITRELGDCVIIEHFDGTPAIPLRGMSVSTYDPRDGKWRQTWVDNSGSYLDFVGELAGDRMILSREVVREGRRIRQRMVWYNIADDSLDWDWERSEDGGESWQLAWKIHYERRR